MLELLPPNWPISTVKMFLLHSIRSSVNTHRTEKIEQSLARGENLMVCVWGVDQGGEPHGVWVGGWSRGENLMVCGWGVVQGREPHGMWVGVVQGPFGTCGCLILKIAKGLRIIMAPSNVLLAL